MIHLKNVYKSYDLNGHHYEVLKDINLEIQSGEIFGIIGKSGGGKSTLIRCMNLLEKPDRGEIYLGQQNLLSANTAELRKIRQSIGMIFQQFYLVNHITVEENIALPLRFAKVDNKKILERTALLIKLVGLEQKAKAYPNQLSGGQKQRVAIARAIACDPKVLLSDEATSALDPHTAREILDLLKQINRELGVTIILISHDMSAVKNICDRVAVLDHGKIVEMGNTLDIFIRPQLAITQHFVHHTLRDELPEDVKSRLAHTPTHAKKPLLRLSFLGIAASKPIIANLMQQFGLELNILQAQIEIIKQESLGTMIVEVLNENKNFNQALAYLTENDVKVEVL